MILDFYTNITLDILKISDKSGEIKIMLKNILIQLLYLFFINKISFFNLSDCIYFFKICC